MIRIGVIGSKSFALYTDQITQQQIFPDIELCYLGDVRTSNILELADQVKDGDYQVLVMGPSDHSIIEGHITTPCYTVQPTISDFLQLHSKINDYTKAVVIFPSSYDLDFSVLEECLHITYQKRTYAKENDIPHILHQLKEDGITTVIGGRSVVDEGKKLGFETLYYFRQTNLEDAVRNAIQISRNVERELNYIEEIQSILENTMCGAIYMTGPNAEISYVNQTALTLLHKKTKDLYQRPIHEFVPKRISNHIQLQNDSESDLQFNLCGIDVIGNIITLPEKENASRKCLLFENTSHILKYETMIRQEIKRKSFKTRYTFDDIIGNSTEIKKAISQAKRFASSNSTILINAETGAGKEVFAQSIHDSSPRQLYPFVAINCASIPDTLIESELFGYAPGAFTGASSKGKTGLVELANHGTVFLDDIDSLSPNFQAKLLRVMQEREIIRVGGNSPIPVDVRFIVATNRNLKQMVENGTFRNDLYFRVNVLHLHIPPLRNRPEDILTLYSHYLHSFDAELYSLIEPRLSQVFSPATTYSYPGNIRELISITERFVSLVDPLSIDDDNYLRQLVFDCLDIDQPLPSPSENLYLSISGNYTDDLADAEHQILNRYLQQHNGNMTQLAKQLGISRTTLYNKLKSASQESINT